MKTIDQINFAGKRALIRVDFNVPLDNDFNITDDNRMTAALPTIKKILNDGGAVILMSFVVVTGYAGQLSLMQVGFAVPVVQSAPSVGPRSAWALRS